MNDHVTLPLDGYHVRTLTDWGRALDHGARLAGGASIEVVDPLAAMGRHARRHGAAVAWRADETFLILYTVDGMLRQKVCPAAMAA